MVIIFGPDEQRNFAAQNLLKTFTKEPQHEKESRTKECRDIFLGIQHYPLEPCFHSLRLGHNLVTKKTKKLGFLVTLFYVVATLHNPKLRLETCLYKYSIAQISLNNTYSILHIRD